MTEDVSFYVEEARRAGGPVVELAVGTGRIAIPTAAQGIRVIGIDSSPGMLEVCHERAELAGVASLLDLRLGDLLEPPVDERVRLVTCPFRSYLHLLGDEERLRALGAARELLVPGGRLVFESRDPARAAWLEWTRDQTYRRVVVPGAGPVETWTDLTAVEGNLVSFRTTFVLGRRGTVLTSDSTLRFRSHDELTHSLLAVGLVVDEVRSAPDRPGREFVFITHRPP